MIMGGASASGISSPAAAPSPAIEVPDPIAQAAPVSASAPAQSTDPAPLSERTEGSGGPAHHETGSAAAMLADEEFWSDLKAFLVQRLRDEAEGERLADVFKEAARS